MVGTFLAAAMQNDYKSEKHKPKNFKSAEHAEDDKGDKYESKNFKCACCAQKRSIDS
jgi:hypothetical protein